MRKTKRIAIAIVASFLWLTAVTCSTVYINITRNVEVKSVKTRDTEIINVDTLIHK